MQSQSDREAVAAQHPSPELAEIEATAARLVHEHQVMSKRHTDLQAECNRLREARREEAALRFQAQCAQAALEIHLARVCAELAVLKGETPAVAS